MAGIRYEIKRYFQEGDALAKLILVNLGFFVLYLLISIVSLLFQSDFAEGFSRWVALPAYLPKLATRPWTLITSMFFHQGFLHFLLNMLYLFFSGRLFVQYLGGRKLLSTYLMGGLAGGILYIISYNLFPVFREALPAAYALGASAGVMAVLVGIATYAPNFEVRLFFTLRIKLWIVAAIMVFLDLVNFQDGNYGGHIAHIGGALFGYLAISQLKNGNDIIEPFSKMMDRLANLFSPKPRVRKVYSKTKTDYEYKERKVHSQQRMDEILDKVSRSGYDSLSKEEKDFLFKIGKD